MDRRANDGHTYACKPCIKAANAASKARVPVEVKRERWRKENKTAAGLAKKKRWTVENPERHKEIRRKSRETNREAIAASWKAYHAANRDALNARRRAKYDAEKKRLSRDPEAGKRYSAERRARQRGLPTEKIDRAELYKRDGGCCQICKQPVPEKGWEMDHIVPIILGGPHLWINVQVACRTCNRQKGKRLEGQVALPVAVTQVSALI